MRIKIFIFPLIVIVTLYLVIAHIFPDVSRAKTTRAAIDQQKQELQEVQAQQVQVTQLYGTFAPNTIAYEDILAAIPLVGDPEFIINQMSKLAAKHNVALTLIGFEEQDNRRRTASRVATLDGVGAQQSPTLMRTQARVDVSGSYESVRNFLSEAFFIGRAGEFSSATLERIDGSETDGSGNERTVLQDLLSTQVTFDFYHMPRFLVTTIEDFAHPVLLQPNYAFDYTLATKWRTRVVQGLSGIETVTGGRPNPFLP